MSGVALHWFRKGLRLHDNKALLNAIAPCKTLIPLYVLDTKYLDAEKVGVNRMAFLLESLKCLDDELRERGSRLFVAKGNPLDVMKDFIEKFNVEKITFERDTEPYNKHIEEEMIKMAKDFNVQVEESWGHTLFNPDYLLNLNNGKAPLTMTGFLKIAGMARAPAKPLDAPNEIPGPPSDITFDNLVYDGTPTLSDLEEHGYNQEEKTTWFVAGEKEAIRRMEEFLKQKERVAEFEKPKTDPTSLVPDTTALSPYLSLGVLSVRLFYYRLKDTLKSTKASKPPVSLEGQIYWRELAYLIGYSTPNFNKMAGNPVCKQIPWLQEGDEALKLVNKWEMGQTGYPAVDAAMNQLRTEGWMHHLARHLVACFLTRGDLWISWELGRDVFEKYLVDADWSINNFSWHWLSCSAFFHQYWRCYGPTTFFKKTDSRGLYIRKHLPLLKKYPDKFIYEPWLAPKNIQEAAKCLIGADYPKPIVDHSIVSKINMDKMKAAYAQAKSLEPPNKKTKSN